MGRSESGAASTAYPPLAALSRYSKSACSSGTSGATATPNKTSSTHPHSEIISAVFVETRDASQPNAIAPGAPMNWIISIVPMMKMSGMRSVSAANAPAMARTVCSPSLKSR